MKEIKLFTASSQHNYYIFYRHPDKLAHNNSPIVGEELLMYFRLWLRPCVSGPAPVSLAPPPVSLTPPRVSGTAPCVSNPTHVSLVPPPCLWLRPVYLAPPMCLWPRPRISDSAPAYLAPPPVSLTPRLWLRPLCL